MLTGSCHCGAVSFEIDGEIPEKLTRCTCSFCAKRGALYAYFTPEQFRPTAKEGADATYRWNSHLVAHDFCAICGNATYSDSPDFQPDGSCEPGKRRIGVNARLIDGLEAADWPVIVIDGKNLW